VNLLRLSSSNFDRRLPGSLLVAAGTQYETQVRDARGLVEWSPLASRRHIKEDRLILYHHTAGEVPPHRSTRAELDALIVEARGGKWGLPYNFVVMPGGHHRIWYLNDIDANWPHTYGHNGATAIAAMGNYSHMIPRATMVERMLRLADALATMWGLQVPEWQHRDVYPTECPGHLLSPLLPQKDRQRSADWQNDPAAIGGGSNTWQ
jgi:hypothetical protein